VAVVMQKTIGKGSFGESKNNSQLVSKKEEKETHLKQKILFCSIRYARHVNNF